MLNKYKFLIIALISMIYTRVNATDAWILEWTTVEKLRRWDIHVDDLPKIISGAIDYLMWFVATIALIFVIVWAYKIAFWSVSGDKSAWKRTIWLAILGFILASLSWVILKLIVDNFS